MKLCITLGCVAVILFVSGVSRADNLSRAYNEGYRDGCLDGGGELRDGGNQGYQCIRSGGGSGTESWDVHYIGGLPGGKIGIGGRSVFENNWCQLNAGASTFDFSIVFPRVGMRELVFASPVIGNDVIDAILKGREIHIDGLSFSGQTIVHSEGTMTREGKNAVRIDLKTDCVMLDDMEKEEREYMKSVGVSQGIILEGVNGR